MTLTNDDGTRSESGAAITRRTALLAISGATLGTVLPLGNNAVAATEASGTKTSPTLTPAPDQTPVGGTRSLNGTWEFALSGNDMPPTSSSRTVTPDRSPLGNDGILYGDSTVVTDPSERALDLAGQSHVAVGDPSSLDFTSPGFTIQLTFKYSEDTVIFSKGNRQYSAGVYSGELSFWTEGDGGWPSVSGGDLSSGQWYTATFIVDTDEIRIYVDGELVSSGSHGFSSLPNTDSPLHVGYNSGSDTHGTPVVDTFRAFDTVLSDSQIRDGFDSVPDTAVVWLPFVSALDGTTPDQSVASNDGRLVNDPSFVSGRHGQGLDLAGDAYVSAGSDERRGLASTGFTLQTTVRYDGGSGLVIDRGSSPVSGGTEQFGLGIYDGTASFYMQTADGEYPGAVQTTIPTGEWHTVSVVVDESENRLYLDGELVDSVSHGATGLATSAAAVVVGGNDLDFAVKSTKMFDTPLTAAQIRSKMGPDASILWLTYNAIEDLSVEWRDEDVPGQWAYDDYSVPSGASEWYPPEGQLGWYRREFEIPDGWEEGRLKLRFDGVYSRAQVYLNGAQVADHVGGYTPFEMDVTDAVTEGSNTLAVGVAQRSKSDDMGWQNVTGGITRDVTLVAVPEVHLSDCFVRTSLDDSGASATVDVTAEVRNTSGNALDTANVAVSLTDPDGSTVDSARKRLSSLPADAVREIDVSIPVRDPRPWNPEQPRLYTVAVDLVHDGSTERVTERVGIREVAIDGDELLINGAPVTLRGVNWEEVHLPKHGHAIPSEITRKDAERLVEANVNYVRTAHHPTSEAFLDACDELGIVVEEEAPHMFLGRDRGDPYPEVVVQQTAEMVARDRNRTSVCIWSVANESEWYDCFDTAARLVKEMDSTRPIIFNHDVYNESDPWHDDYNVRAHHYPVLRSGSTVEANSNLPAPILFDEYAHTYCYNDRELVTDPGLRDEWGRVFETIWNRCREAESVAGAALWAGSDHLEQWGEYLWGILDRNRRKRPGFWHVRKAYAPIQFTDAEWSANGHRITLTIENRHEFVDLSERTIEWDNGVRSDTLSIDLLPGERTEASFPTPRGEFEINAMHPNGRTINEFAITTDTPPGDLPLKANSRANNRGSSDDTENRSLSVDSSSNSVEIRSADGTTLVKEVGFALTPTQGSAGREYASIIDHRPSGRTVTDVSRGDESVSIGLRYDIAEGTVTFRPSDRGVNVAYEFTLQEPMDTREAGLILRTIPSLRTFSWSRDGLWSVYPDDHVGRQRGTALAFPGGTRPENEGITIQSGQPWKDDATMYGSNDFRSTKRKVRFAELTDGDGTGIQTLPEDGQHVRAQVRSESVDFLVLSRSISGTNPYEWMNRQPPLDQNPTLSAGKTLRGSMILRAAGK